MLRATHRDEVTLHPGTRGAATVILLPGMIVGDWIWRSTLPLLIQANYSCLTIRDPIACICDSVDAMTSYVGAQLDRLNINDVTLLGASLGSAVALNFAVRYPQRVKELVLSGAPTMTGKADLGIRSSGKLTRSIADQAMGALFFDRSVIDDAIVDRTYQTFLNPRRLINFIRLLRETEDYDTRAALQKIDVDTLMVWGEQDKISRVEDWRCILPLVKRGTFVEIERCGHTPMIELPDRFNAALFEFLNARHPDRTPS